MDCKTCANYEPVKVERPTGQPGRIFAEDLRVGMVIRRHGTQHLRKLVLILGAVKNNNAVHCFQLLAGYKPFRSDMRLAPSGLKSYDESGKWREGAWCEEVT